MEEYNHIEFENTMLRIAKTLDNYYGNDVMTNTIKNSMRGPFR